jgi:hypothetical protein
LIDGKLIALFSLSFLLVIIPSVLADAAAPGPGYALPVSNYSTVSTPDLTQIQTNIISIKDDIGQIKTQISVFTTEAPQVIADAVAAGMNIQEARYAALQNEIMVKMVVGFTGGFILALAIYALVSGRVNKTSQVVLKSLKEAPAHQKPLIVQKDPELPNLTSSQIDYLLKKYGDKHV